MGKLVVVENVSLDGVMQAPGRADEDTRNGFSRGGWGSELLARDPAAMQASMGDSDDSNAMLFGHRTYRDLVGHWLSTDEPNPFAEVLRARPKYVAAHTRPELPHPNSTWLGADTPDADTSNAVRRLKESHDGEIVVLGSGELVRSLAAAHLVDEYLLTILPVVIGSGQRLFADTYAPLEVVKSVTSPTGIVIATYRVVHE